jgi:hypothetical protein
MDEVVDGLEEPAKMGCNSITLRPAFCEFCRYGA